MAESNDFSKTMKVNLLVWSKTWYRQVRRGWFWSLWSLDLHPGFATAGQRIFESKIFSNSGFLIYGNTNTYYLWHCRDYQLVIQHVSLLA